MWNYSHTKFMQQWQHCHHRRCCVPYFLTVIVIAVVAPPPLPLSILRLVDCCIWCLPAAYFNCGKANKGWIHWRHLHPSSSPVENQRAETCSWGPLIVHVDAMMAGSDNGLPLRQVGPQRLQQRWLKNWWVQSSLNLVASCCYVMGVTLIIIPLMLRHPPLVCNMP